MAEYIKRETAVRAVMAAKWVDSSDGAIAMEIVASPAAADVAPVVHGQWGDNGIPGSMLRGCSVCGFTCGASSFFYCPSCGARMDGGNDDAAD